MIVVGLLIAFIVGFVFGAVWRPEEDCPAAVLGYDCNGETCDHRKSTLYGNMAIMARHAEKREREQQNN